MSKKRPLDKDDPVTLVFIALLVMFFVVLRTSTLWVHAFGSFGRVLFAVVTVGGIFGVLAWHSSQYDLVCRSCGRRFTISFWRESVVPRRAGEYYLRCPFCGKRAWADTAIKE